MGIPKMINLKYPNCGADISSDFENIGAYCTHCGSKLMFDMDTVKKIVEAKEKTNQVRIQEEEKTRRLDMEQKAMAEDKKGKIGMPGL